MMRRSGPAPLHSRGYAYRDDPLAPASFGDSEECGVSEWSKTAGSPGSHPRGDESGEAELNLSNRPLTLPASPIVSPRRRGSFLKGEGSLAFMFASLLQLMRRDVTRGVAGTILLKVGSGGLAFALFSLAARAMSPEAFGDFATWLSVAQIASVVGLIGQELLLVRFLNEYEVKGRTDLAKGCCYPA